VGEKLAGNGRNSGCCFANYSDKTPIKGDLHNWLDNMVRLQTEEVVNWSCNSLPWIKLSDFKGHHRKGSLG